MHISILYINFITSTNTPALKLIAILLLGRYEDLKEMLDQNKDSLKLDAMKRIIGVGN